MDKNVVESVKDSLSANANASQFFISINGLANDSLNLLEYQSSDYSISNDYCFHVSTLGRDAIAPNTIIGKKATITNVQGEHNRLIHGVVTGMQHIRTLLDAEEHVIVIQSPITVLKHFSHNRVFINKNIITIIEEVLLSADLSAADFNFKTRFDYPQHEFIVQYAENDFDFIQRLLAIHGIFYRFDQTEEQAVIVFYDNSDDLPMISGNTSLDYILETGTIRNVETITNIFQRSQLLTQSYQLKDYNYRSPEAHLENYQQNTSKVKGSGNCYTYGEHYLTLDAGEQQVKIELQSIDWQRSTFLIETDCRAVAPGSTLSVNGHPNDNRNGDYLIVEVLDMLANQRAAQLIHAGNKETNNQKATKTFFATLRAIKVGIPYRSKIIPRPYVNGSFSARVESTGGEYAYLDEQGRYKIRMDFDIGDSPMGDASHPVRMAQAYTGSDYGIHFPLHAQTEVLISCINGDINRPIILGTVPNPEHPSPVTSKNNSHNILRSFSGNELLLDDTVDAEKIELFTKDQQNSLSLDAKKGKHKVRLATEQGAMEIKAGKNMMTDTGGSQFLEVGNSHQIMVNNRHRLMTKNKAINQTAGTDIIKTAEKNVSWNSETENVELTVGNDMIVEVEENCSFEVKNGDMNFRVNGGNFEIEAAKTITLLGSGSGNITLKQSGAIIEIKSSGEINIEGTTVNIDAQSINIKGGMFNHNPGAGTGGSGATASGNSGSANFSQNAIAAYSSRKSKPRVDDTQAKAANSPSEQAIAAIKQKNKSPQIPILSWSDKRFTAGKIVHQIFKVKNIQPGDTATISVFECDSNGQETQIDSIDLILEQGDAQYQNAWKRSISDAETDMSSDTAAGQTGPLEYKYRVSINGIISKDSNTLLMPTTYEVIVKNDTGSAARAISNETYIVKKDGTEVGQGITSEQGSIVFRCVDTTAIYTVEIFGHEITVTPKEMA